jgi:hypothetical protein
MIFDLVCILYIVLNFVSLMILYVEYSLHPNMYNVKFVICKLHEAKYNYNIL